MSESTVGAAGGPARAGWVIDPLEYEALRTLETRLGAELVDRARAARTPQEPEMWRRRHVDQRLKFARVDPRNARAIAALRKEFTESLRDLG